MLQNWQAFLYTRVAGNADRRCGEERNDSNNDNNDTRIAVIIMSEHSHVQYVRSML